MKLSAEANPGLIGGADGAVMEQARAWQSRPLDPFYGIVFLDSLPVKIWHEGRAEERAAHVALGVNLEGRKDALGLWISTPEGAAFWLQALTELRDRGVRDIYLICMDGLKGLPQGIDSIYPKAHAQLSIAHMIRASLSYITWPDRDKVVADLKPIYKAATAVEAERRRSQFGAKWPKYPAIARLWREQWGRVIPFFVLPEEVRNVLYTTKAVESLQKSLGKIIKERGSFSSEEAAFGLLYPALRKVAAKSERLRHWKPMLNYLDTESGDRIREAGVL